MSVPFFFAENILSDDEIILDEESSRHIVQVLRMKSGEKILLTDGRGNAIDGEIGNANKKHCTVNKIAVSFAPRRSPALTIGISLTKNTSRFEWFLEKATELGTAVIIPMICDRTEKQHARYERLASICRSAMLQSNQVWMPEMHQPSAFKDVVKNAVQQQKLFGHIAGETKSLSETINISKDSHIVLIGPEGDFSEEEVVLAKASGFEGVSFGKTILRVETAGIYAAVMHAGFTQVSRKGAKEAQST
ncbi:MAG: 16S rRNA (uracil(1498)-N(3))-methyltransferase [Chitinophagaceae bacterium]|nr:16S rRNA (uracil(1498)-N(3))-methyltransferase [Chitinophagaceae bacterium]